MVGDRQVEEQHLKAVPNVLLGPVQSSISMIIHGICR